MPLSGIQLLKIGQHLDSRAKLLRGWQVLQEPWRWCFWIFARDQAPSRGRPAWSLRLCWRILIEQAPWILFNLLDTVAAYFLSTFARIDPPPIRENSFYLAYLSFISPTGIFLALFTGGALHKKNVVQTFRSAVLAGLKSCTTLKKNAAYLWWNVVQTFRATVSGRAKVLHYIKAGAACRRITTAIIIAKTTYNFSW